MANPYGSLGSDISSSSGSAGGAVLAALPVLGSLASTYMSNKANAEATKYASDMDYRKWREYLDYSDTKEQVRRMRNAGMNPALAMANGAIDSGNPSSPSAETKYPTYDFSPIAQGMRDSVDLYQNYRLQNAQIDNMNASTQNQRIRNNFEDRRQFLELIKIRNEGKLSKQQAELVDTQIEMLGKQIGAFDAQNSADLNLKAMQAKEHEAHADFLRAQESYQKIVNQYAPQERQKILRNLDATYKDILASAYEHNESAARQAAERALANARKEGVDISNEVADEIIDAAVDKAYAEADEAFFKAQNEAKGYYQGLPGKLVPQHLDMSTGQTLHYSTPPSAHRKHKRKKFGPVPNKKVPRYQVID